MAARKTCGDCGETKLLSEFNKNPQTKDGHRADCKPCKRKKDQARRASREFIDPPTCRVCSDCRIEKPIEDFVKTPDRLDGRALVCKLCNQDRARSNRFNIPRGWYDVMLAKQGGKCGIDFCSRRAEDTPKGVLYVDHDRACCPGDSSCGKCVRGLICTYCNSALGFINDSRGHLIALINYLDSAETASTNERL